MDRYEIEGTQPRATCPVSRGLEAATIGPVTKSEKRRTNHDRLIFFARYSGGGRKVCWKKGGPRNLNESSLKRGNVSEESAGKGSGRGLEEAFKKKGALTKRPESKLDR